MREQRIYRDNELVQVTIFVGGSPSNNSFAARTLLMPLYEDIVCRGLVGLVDLIDPLELDLSKVIWC